MSKHEFELPPLPSDIASLLASERGRSGPSSDVQTRMLGSICTTLGFPVPVVPGPGPGEGGDGGASGLGGTGATGSGASGTGGLPGLSHAVAAVVKPATLIAFAVGVVTGAGTVILTKRDRVAPPTEVKHVQTSQATAPTARVAPAPVAPRPEAEPREEVTSAGTPPRAVARSKTSGGAVAAQDGAGLAAERDLIEMAWAALTRGRPDDALRALEGHRRQFPRGHLSEEREAVWVLALVAKGNLADAQTGATRFAKKYPGSLLRAVIDEALQKANMAK